MAAKVRLIAFYLPQFHPIEENDEWWGRGFTEWRNVVRARSLFPGHYQPHLPADLGFYDLRVPEVRQAQADLAKEYGIFGFCYYHYWFGGRRLLERPFAEVLSSGEPDFPFCLCWANEDWTRGWDGRSQHILMEQTYSLEDDVAHIRSLLSAFEDKRYIRINGKPLFLVYRPEKLPNPVKTAEIWRREVNRAGLDELYLAGVESFHNRPTPASLGFDAAVEFAPDWRNVGEPKFRTPFYRLAGSFGLISHVYFKHTLTHYAELAVRMLDKTEPDYLLFRCVTPGFDNSPRRSEDSAIFLGSTPEIYENWLGKVVKITDEKREGDERIVFINAWNEWAEGNHLEPDQKYGRAFLEATYKAMIAGTSAAAIGSRVTDGQNGRFSATEDRRGSVSFRA